MGDIEVHLPKQNGSYADRSTSPSLPEFSNPHPSEISEEKWRLAEYTTQRIIRQIQPTKVSEERRRNVVEYVQKLITTFLGIEVFPFGSVPLKTYLPDGDIDLTALGLPIYEDSLAGDVCAVLEGEENNKASEFEVKDVQYIHAEVKLVKCLVQNIVVDISFNQIGGLSTLYFLEQVDGIIGKNHLFKRSIILIKAWCYYESRILGAHHSLISTYALETLILYIFNFFHSSIDGPLAVLYKFLDYFGKFDWDSFCISLRGPVRVTSLPDIVAEVPETEGGDHLLSTEFLNRCGEVSSATPRASENTHRLFVKKHLNIVDPLKENNNLGRSVSKGNLYRIRSAFAYGARKLGKILLLSAESIPDELNKFFKNTLERHGSGERPDVQDSYSCFQDTASFDFNDVANLLSNINTKKDGLHNTAISSLEDNSHGINGNLNGIQIPETKKENGQGTDFRIQSSDPLLSGNSVHYCKEIKSEPLTNPVSGPDLTEGREHLTIISTLDPRDTIGMQCRSPDTSEVSPSYRAHHAPHLFFRKKSVTLNNGCTANDLISEDRLPDENELADLSGDRERHYRNLLRAQWYHEVFVNGPVSAGNSFSSPQYGVQRHNVYPNVNGVVPGPPFPSTSSYYQMNQSFISGPYIMDNMRKTRGTGTYFPNTNHRTYREKSSIGRGKTPHVPSHGMRARNDSHMLAPSEFNLTDVGTREPHPPGRLTVPGVNDWGKSGYHDYSPASSPVSRGLHQSNGITPAEFHFGSFGPVSLDAPIVEPGGNLDSSGSHNHIFGPALSSSTARKPGINSNRERYRLKDDVEFPPLSGRGHPNLSVHSDEHKPTWEIKRDQA